MTRNFSELEAKMPAAARKQAQAMAQDMLADLLLAEVRQLTGMTQQQLAGELGIRQSSVSKLEKQEDMQVSTLQRLIGALGGELEIIAHMPQGDIRIQGFPGAAQNQSQGGG